MDNVTHINTYRYKTFKQRLRLITERLQAINELLDDLKELNNGQSQPVRRKNVQTEKGKSRNYSQMEKGAETD